MRDIIYIYPTLHQIAADIFRDYGVSLDEIRSPARISRINRARKAFCQRAVAEQRWTIQQIANFIHRHYSTVLQHIEDRNKTRAPRSRKDLSLASH